MRAYLISALAAVAVLGGCSIHPLPEDVARVTSFDIVRQIRCETRDTIRRAVIEWLDRLAKRENLPLFEQLVSQYRADPASIKNFHYNLFTTYELSKVSSTAKLFFDTGVAYNFDLNGTESNDLSAELNFFKPYPISNFSLGVSAGANRKRNNVRTFTVTDTFSGLLKVPEDFCEGQVVGPNYFYPISGRIGVDKLVNDFIYITLFGNLSAEGVTANKAPGLPYMVDELTFTTVVKVGTSPNPNIVFNPVTPAFRFANAGLTAMAERTDQHKVTVGLAIAPSGAVELAPLRAFLLGSASTASRTIAGPAGLVVGARVIGGGTEAERLAVLAVDQLKSREVQLVPPF